MSVISDTSSGDTMNNNSSFEEHSNEHHSPDKGSHDVITDVTNDVSANAENVKNATSPDDEKKSDGKCPPRGNDKSRTHGNTIRWKNEDPTGDDDSRNTKKEKSQSNEIETKRISKIVKKKL